MCEQNKKAHRMACSQVSAGVEHRWKSRAHLRWVQQCTCRTCQLLLDRQRSQECCHSVRRSRHREPSKRNNKLSWGFPNRSSVNHNENQVTHIKYQLLVLAKQRCCFHEVIRASWTLRWFFFSYWGWLKRRERAKTKTARQGRTRELLL